MNKYQFYILFLFGLLGILSCQNQNEIKPLDQSETSGKVDRNMFGRNMPRGIVLNSDEATPGYTMFCVTNSPYTYLINRTGEVVHQWKSNYGVQGGYLADDGSIVVNAYDVDFPTFAGGGESGRIQKIDWDSKILWDFELLLKM